MSSPAREPVPLWRDVVRTLLLGTLLGVLLYVAYLALSLLDGVWHP